MPSNDPRVAGLFALCCAVEGIGLNSILFFDEQNFFFLVHFAQPQFNHFLARRLHPASDKGGINRELPVPAINQYAELHLLWPALAK